MDVGSTLPSSDVFFSTIADLMALPTTSLNRMACYSFGLIYWGSVSVRHMISGHILCHQSNRIFEVSRNVNRYPPMV